MIIYLDEIYSSLEWWRAENRIKTENEINSYLINVMQDFGKLSQALRGLEFENTHKAAEYEIIEALCNISVLTINAGADIPTRKKQTEIDTSEIERHNLFNVSALIIDCANLDRSGCTNHLYFNYILKDCSNLCKQFGHSFELAMLEKIKVISLGNGVYNKKANYEKARIKNE